MSAIKLGTILEVQSRDHGIRNFIAAGYDERDYLRLTMKDNSAVFMTIHPGHVKRIAENGSDSGVKVLNAHNLNDIVVKATEAVADVPTTIPTIVHATPTTVAPSKSKKDRALAIKAANPNATRKELIAMFIEQLDMTPAGASTYASMK